MISFEDRTLTPAEPPWNADLPSLALAEVIGASLDLTETLRAAASALRTVTGADRTLIYLHDPVHATLRQIVATADALDWDELVPLQGRSVGSIPLWYAVRDCPSGALELPDTVSLRALTRDRARQIGMAATLGLALRHPSVRRADDTPLGIAFCCWERPQPAFAAHMVRRARSIAAQAAVAIANSHNHEQGEELVKRLSTLAAWAAKLAAAGTPGEVRSRAARAGGVLLDGPFVAHWSPGAATWYPAPALHGAELEPALAALAGGTDRFRALGPADLSVDLAAALAARGLGQAIVGVAQDRSSLLFVGRERAAAALDGEIITLLADLAGSALRTAEAHEKVAHLALTDPLTDVGNRRAFEARVGQALALSSRTERPTSLCLIDLDNFRAFNESGGHQTGDEALRLVAEALRAEMRTSDQAFRIGGDEFALVLTDTPASSAVTLLERVCTKLRDTHLGGLSITAGIAEAPGHGRSAETLYQAADAALYSGKRAGRARIMLAGAPE